MYVSGNVSVEALKKGSTEMILNLKIDILLKRHILHFVLEICWTMLVGVGMFINAENRNRLRNIIPSLLFFNKDQQIKICNT